MSEFDRDQILAVIGRLAWRFATTMPTRPHEYTVRSPANEADYVTLAQAVLDHGVLEWAPERPGKRRYRNRYFRPGDGMKYWLMTTSIRQSRIINRARIDS
jgi:hypothetical protein